MHERGGRDDCVPFRPAVRHMQPCAAQGDLDVDRQDPPAEGRLQVVVELQRVKRDRLFQPALLVLPRG